jgi:hypothetical protein
MADSLRLDTADNSVPFPIAGHKSSLSDDVRLKLAQRISADFFILHVLLIPGKRNKTHLIQELQLMHTNEYRTPVTITQATHNKWRGKCIFVLIGRLKH